MSEIVAPQPDSPRPDFPRPDSPRPSAPPVQVTERLRLRPLTPSDAALIGLYANDARVARMTTAIPHPYPPGTAEGFVERNRTRPGDKTVWAMDTGTEDENGLVGLISLRRCESEGELTGAIGYWVAPAFWGTGYASEAVEAIVSHATTLGFSALVAQAFQDNAASTKVLSRAGFGYVGDGELHSVARGAMVPTFRYRRDLTAAS